MEWMNDEHQKIRQKINELKKEEESHKEKMKLQNELAELNRRKWKRKHPRLANFMSMFNAN